MQDYSSVGIHCINNSQVSLNLPGESRIDISGRFDLAEGMQSANREGLLKRQESFLRYWDEVGDGLTCPDVFLAITDPGSLEDRVTESMKGLKGLDQDNCKPLAALSAVWTIGKKLESDVARLFDVGKSMHALFLDVIGSILLIRMHQAVQVWLREQVPSALPGYTVVGELYPGSNIDYTVNLENLLARTKADSVITAVGDNSMLNPCKSMYSFFFVGKGEESFVKYVERCPVCNGKACLYFQLGGCHHSAT